MENTATLAPKVSGLETEAYQRLNDTLIQFASIALSRPVLSLGNAQIFQMY